MQLNDVRIKVLDVVHVSEDKGSVEVKPASDNVLGIFDCRFLEPAEILQLFFIGILIEELLVVGHLNDYVAFEGFLQVLAKDKGKQMAQMH